jgi:hypothetical protein
MKKIIFITLLFCGLAFTAQSQSLTYSKVILLTSLDTVPQGKVWKVTSYLSDNAWIHSSSSSAPVTNKEVGISINSSYVALGMYTGNYAGGNSAVSGTSNTPFPIWLPAGTTLEPSTNCGSLSIIEFTETNE